MHAAGGQSRPPTPSALTADRPLDAHFACHAGALAMLALAVLLDSVPMARVAAMLGLVGALAFAAFFVVAVRRLAASEAGARRSAPG
jgi:hypothetical protein